jgi:hypothetical protein
MAGPIEPLLGLKPRTAQSILGPRAGLSKGEIMDSQDSLPEGDRTEAGSLDPEKSKSYKRRARLGIILLVLIYPVFLVAVLPPTENDDWSFPLSILVGFVIVIWTAYTGARLKAHLAGYGLPGLTAHFLGRLLLGGFWVCLVLFFIWASAVDRRANCDGLARANLERLQLAFGTLADELANLGVNFDDSALETVIKENAVKYLAGPHYGWPVKSARAKKCEVLMRFTKEKNGWIAESVSLQGNRTNRENSRYCNRIPLPGGERLQEAAVKDVSDAKDGNPLHWNSYPLAPEMCYTESIIDKDATKKASVLRLKQPKGRPCSESRD